MRSWELTQEIFDDWWGKGFEMEKVFSGIRLSEEETRQINDLWYWDWIMNEHQPQKYSDQERARIAQRNSDFWDNLVEHYGLDRGWPFTIDSDGIVHFWRLSE